MVWVPFLLDRSIPPACSTCTVLNGMSGEIVLDWCLVCISIRKQGWGMFVL